MVPVFPDKVRVVLFVPEQTVASPVIVPATVVGFTVTVTVKVAPSQGGFGKVSYLVTTTLAQPPSL